MQPLEDTNKMNMANSFQISIQQQICHHCGTETAGDSQLTHLCTYNSPYIAELVSMGIHWQIPISLGGSFTSVTGLKKCSSFDDSPSTSQTTGAPNCMTHEVTKTFRWSPNGQNETGAGCSLRTRHKIDEQMTMFYRNSSCD